MILLPAIDLYGGKAVRLYKGDYNEMTVYSNNPIEIARKFEQCGATFIHMVDLEGAKNGTTPNIDEVRKVVEYTNLKVEIGGGIRSMDTIQKYISAGASRVILGTAAVTDEAFLKEALSAYGEKIAVGADIADGKVAIKGWLEKSAYDVYSFLEKMQSLGVKTIICTDVSKDGAMKGANHSLYKELTEKYQLQIIASGGVSSMDDIQTLTENGVYGAIIGKAYYIGAIDLKEAIEVAR